MTPTPGPYRAEGATIKAITHGRWFTVARVDTRQFTPEGSVTNAAHIARCVNSHDALVAALRALTATARTFRNVPKDEQEWTSLDDDALDNAFRVLSALDKSEA